MRVHLFFILFCLFLPVLLIFPAQAQLMRHQAHCDMNDSTAAAADCLRKHLDSAQNQLKVSYNKLTAGLDGETLGDLKLIQSNWLDYRDSQCNWEAARAQNKALQHLDELSCMARMTEDRAELIKAALDDSSTEGVQRQYGSFPRWMNVLTKDHPDIFWQYSSYETIDLTCDGQEEMVMLGTRLKAGTTDSSVIVALATTPPTGRPRVDLLDFPMKEPGDEENGKATLCSTDIQFSFVVPPALAEGEEAATPPEACAARLIAKDKICGETQIGWTGKGFDIIQVPEENIEPAAE